MACNKVNYYFHYIEWKEIRENATTFMINCVVYTRIESVLKNIVLASLASIMPIILYY